MVTAELAAEFAPRSRAHEWHEEPRHTLSGPPGGRCAKIYLWTLLAPSWSPRIGVSTYTRPMQTFPTLPPGRCRNCSGVIRRAPPQLQRGAVETGLGAMRSSSCLDAAELANRPSEWFREP